MINQTVVYDTFAPDDAYDAPKVVEGGEPNFGGSDVVPLRRAGWRIGARVARLRVRIARHEETTPSFPHTFGT